MTRQEILLKKRSESKGWGRRLSLGGVGIIGQRVGKRETAAREEKKKLPVTCQIPSESWRRRKKGRAAEGNLSQNKDSTKEEVLSD